MLKHFDVRSRSKLFCIDWCLGGAWENTKKKFWPIRMLATIWLTACKFTNFVWFVVDIIFLQFHYYQRRTLRSANTPQRETDNRKSSALKRLVGWRDSLLAYLAGKPANEESKENRGRKLFTVSFTLIVNVTIIGAECVKNFGRGLKLSWNPTQQWGSFKQQVLILLSLWMSNLAV